MSWLRRLFVGSGEPAPPSATPAFVADGGNRVHALLDAAGLPWREPRGALIATCGIRRHAAYDWDVIEMPTGAPLSGGLLWPISAQAMLDLSPLMPATSLSGVTWFSDDAEANIRRTVRHLEPALGPAKITPRHNTLHCEWRSGMASLSLTVWPPAQQGDWADSNPSHEREPRLRTGCHISIETGLLAPLTERERAWLDAWQAIAPSGTSGWSDGPAPESQLPFIRQTPADIEIPAGTIGRAAGGEALILNRRWLYIVPTADILRFEVTRMTRAKGPGGSYLTIVCAVAGAGEAQLNAADAPGPDDLNDLGERLGRTFGKPVTLSPYWADC